MGVRKRGLGLGGLELGLESEPLSGVGLSGLGPRLGFVFVFVLVFVISAVALADEVGEAAFDEVAVFHK